MKESQNNICVIGLGYVGLTLALTLSECGIKVMGIDSNNEVVNSLNRGEPHFYEEGLPQLLKRQLKKNFWCSQTIPKGRSFNIYIIAVGTKVKEDRRPDFNELQTASEMVGKIIKKGDLVILRSTVPVGVTRNYVIPILEKISGLEARNDFYIVFAPERTIEGDALRELKILPQIIGGLDENSIDKARTLFRKFTPKIVVLDSLEGAEMIKMLNNSYRDLNFAFANETALVCNRFNLNVNKIIKAANLNYTRSQIPMPSPGVGGYCLTKDPYLFVYSSKRRAYTPKLPLLGRDINDKMPLFVYKKIIRFFNKYHRDKNKIKHLTLCGLAFKGIPPTSDIRYSPTLALINLLKRHRDIRLHIHDFVVPRKTIANLGLGSVEDIKRSFKEKHCVVIMNNHPFYKNLDVPSLSRLMQKPALIIDTWGFFEPDNIVVEEEGVHYSNLGHDSFNKNFQD